MRAKMNGTRTIPLLLLLALLSGCSGADNGENALTLELRADFLAMDGCSGTMDVTADYGERVYDYTVSFSGNKKDGMEMVLTAPETVAGITAKVAEGSTYLEFDGVSLETGPLNEDGLSPLDALPVLIAEMQSGYIAETCTEQQGEQTLLRISCREPQGEAGKGRETVLWFDTATKRLVSGELRSDGFTVIRCSFSAFTVIPPTAEE